MPDEQQLDYARFLQRFRERAAERGYNTKELDDEALIAKIAAKRPDVGDKLNLSYRSKVLKEGLPSLVEDARKIGEGQRKNAPATNAAALAMRVIPGVLTPGVGDMIGEYAAQKMEGSDRAGQRGDTNLKTVVTQGAVGALPWNKVKKLKQLAETAPTVTGAIKGSVSGALGSGAFALTEEGRLPSLQELALPAVAGGGIGALAGRFGPQVVRFLANKLGISEPEAAAKLAGSPGPGGGGPTPPPLPPKPAGPGDPSTQGKFPGQYGVSTQPPPMPPGFRAEAFMGDVQAQNAGMSRLNSGGHNALPGQDALLSQPSLPGMPLRRPDLDLPQQDEGIEAALSGSPEGQALLAFMQGNRANDPRWRTSKVSQPKGAKKAKVPPAVPGPTPAATQATAPVMPSAPPAPAQNAGDAFWGEFTTPAPKPAAPEVPAPQPTFRPGTAEAAGHAGAPPSPLADIESEIARLTAIQGTRNWVPGVDAPRLAALQKARDAAGTQHNFGFNGPVPFTRKLPADAPQNRLPGTSEFDASYNGLAQGAFTRAGERGSAPVGDVGDVAAAAVGGLAGAAYDPEHPFEGALTGAAMAFAAKRGAQGLAGARASKGAGSAAGKVVDAVEGVTPTGQQFVRQNPVAIPKAERLKPGHIPLSRLDNIGLEAGKMPTAYVPTLERLLSDLSATGELEIQRRGVQPIKLIEQLASRQKVRVDKPGSPGAAYNSEELLAMAYANVGAAKKVDDILKTQGTPEYSEPKFAEAIMQARATTLTFSGAAAEAGRAMRTLQTIRNVMAIGDPELIQKAIREAGGEQRLRYIAKELSKLPDDIDLRRERLNELLDDGTVRFMERTFQASLLSSAKLHMLNSVSNSFMTAYRVGALPFRAAVGEVQGAMGQTQGFSWEAVKPATVALIDGAKQGAQAAAYVWKHGITPGQAQGMSGAATGLNSGRFDVPMPEFRESGYGPWNAVNMGYNKVLRALGAADQFFSTLNTHSSRMGIAATVAHNEATAAKLVGDKFRAHMEKRIPEILLKEDLNLEEAAIREGRRAVGQEDMGAIGNALLAMRETPGTGFLVPFIKTTLNLFRQGIELSPAAPLSRQWREAAGGAGHPDAQVAAVEQAEALGRTLFGTTVLAGFYMGKQAGYFNIRGALPLDPNESARMLNEGKQPYSIELMVDGKQYAIPFRVLGPLAIPLGMMGDYFDTFDKAEKESDKVDILRRLAQNMAESTAFGQIVDFGEMVRDPKKILNHISRIVAVTSTPGYGLSSNIALGNDQTMRDKPDALRLIDELGWQEGLGTAHLQNMPVIGGTIQHALFGKNREKQPLRGPLGDPMERYTPDWVPPAGRFAYHALNPVPVQQINPEMGQIQPLTKDWEIGPKRAPIALNIEGEAALREAKGKATREAIARLEADPRYRALPKDKQQEKRDNFIRQVRAREAREMAAKTMREAKRKQK